VTCDHKQRGGIHPSVYFWEVNMERCLVLFSGGKDSFISTCKMVEEGYQVSLISFNNGAVVGEENLLHGVTRLQNRYGKERVVYEGIYNTASIISRINEYWTYTPQSKIGKEYPSLVNAQVTCLHCQTAMWVSAIAYAVSHNIKVIVSGCRKSDPFCTGQSRWINAISELAALYEIKIKIPVWDDEEWVKSGGWERDQEMARRSFEPQVLEPKCLLGRPVNRMNRGEIYDMIGYFNNHINDSLKSLIDYLIPIFKYIRLSEKSLTVIHYPVPDPTTGIY